MVCMPDQVPDAEVADADVTAAEATAAEAEAQAAFQAAAKVASVVQVTPVSPHAAPAAPAAHAVVGLAGHFKTAAPGSWLPVVRYVVHVCPANCSPAAFTTQQWGGATRPAYSGAVQGVEACTPCCQQARLVTFRYSTLLAAWPAIQRGLLLARGDAGVSQEVALARANASNWTPPPRALLGVLWDSVADTRMHAFQRLFNQLHAGQCMDLPALQWLLR